MGTNKNFGVITEEQLFQLLKGNVGNLSGFQYEIRTPFCMTQKHFKILTEDGSPPILNFGAGNFKSYFILSDLDCGGLDISQCTFKVTPAILSSVRFNGGRFYDGGALRDLMKQNKLKEWGRPIPDGDFPEEEQTL